MTNQLVPQLKQLYQSLFGGGKQGLCKHRFALEDLHKTGDGEDSPTRVEWACDKCGKVFKAHCGLDISPRHGQMFHRRQT